MPFLQYNTQSLQCLWSTGIVSTHKMWQRQKIREKFRLGDWKTEAAGESHRLKAPRLGSRPLLLFNCCSARASHRLNCGKARGGRELVQGGLREIGQEGWSWSQPMKDPNQSWGKYFLHRKSHFISHGTGWKTPSLSHLETDFTKRQFPRGGIWPWRRKRLRDHMGLFQLQLPRFLKPSASSQLPVASLAKAWLSGSAGLSILRPGCSYWCGSAWGLPASNKSLQSQHPRKQPHLALGHWGHGGYSIQGPVLPGPGTQQSRPGEGGTAQSLLHLHISPGACWKRIPFDIC